MSEEAPVTSAVPLVEVVMSVLYFAPRWLEPVGRTVTYERFTTGAYWAKLESTVPCRGKDA